MNVMFTSKSFLADGMVYVREVLDAVKLVLHEWLRPFVGKTLRKLVSGQWPVYLFEIVLKLQCTSPIMSHPSSRSRRFKSNVPVTAILFE